MTDLAVSQLQSSTIAVISAHMPGLHLWASAGLGPSSSSPKQWKTGSQMVMLRFTTLSARDCHWRNPRKKNYRECSNIKSACVSALTDSVPHKMAKAQQSVQHSSGIEPKLPYSLLLTFTTNLALSHWFISIAQKKLYMTLQISSPATDFLHRTVVLGFFKLKIKAGHEIQEFLNANLLSIHLIAINNYWSWNICTSHIGLISKKSLMWPSFFLFFREIRKKRRHWPGSQSAPRLYNCCNLCPYARPASLGKCWLGPQFKFPETVEDWKSDGHVKIYNSVSTRLPLTKSKKKKL